MRVKKATWGEIGNCCRCGNKATTFFKATIEKGFFRKTFVNRYYCQDCLLEVLDEYEIENTNLRRKK